MSPNTLFSSTRLVFHESTRKLCNVIVWRVANRFTWNSQRNEGLWRFAEKCQCNFSSSHCFHGNERNSQMECLWQNGQPLKIVTILENKSILISSQSIAPDWLGRLLPNHFGASTDIRGIYYKFQTFRYHTNIDSTRLDCNFNAGIRSIELSCHSHFDNMPNDWRTSLLMHSWKNSIQIFGAQLNAHFGTVELTELCMAN